MPPVLNPSTGVCAVDSSKNGEKAISNREPSHEETDDWDPFLDFKANPYGTNKRALEHRLLVITS